MASTTPQTNDGASARPALSPGEIVKLLKQTWQEYNADNAPRLGAALAYYTIFSLAPMLLIAIAIAGLVFGEEAARNQIVGQVGGLIGTQGAEAIQAMITNANQPESGGILATITGIVLLIFGASGVFGELQASMNIIWGVKEKPDLGFWHTIRERFFSFGLVLGTGFLLLVSLVLSSALAAIGTYFQNAVPGSETLWQVVNFVASLAVTTLLFAMIYKFIPDVRISWHDVWIGACITALLFGLGRFLIGYYLGSGSVTSVYGAAGSLVVILLWAYYSSQILFLGAEFTQVYANSFDTDLEPTKDAILIDKANTQASAAPQDTRDTAPADVPASGALGGFLAGLLLGRRCK